MKNLSRGAKIALIVTAVLLVSGGSVFGVCGLKKHRASKKELATTKDETKKVSK